MKRILPAIVAVLVLFCLHLANGMDRPRGLTGDDRPGPGHSRTPSPAFNSPSTHAPQTAMPPAAKPGSSVPPIPHNSYTGSQNPQAIKRGHLLENYDRDIKKLGGQYTGLQDKLLKTPVSSPQFKEIQKQMDAVTRQKNARTDQFNKDWNQTLGSQTTPRSSPQSSPKAPLTATPHVPGHSNVPSGRSGHLPGQLPPWHDDLMKRWQEATDILGQKHAHITGNRSMSSAEKAKALAALDQERQDVVNRFRPEFEKEKAWIFGSNTLLPTYNPPALPSRPLPEAPSRDSGGKKGGIQDKAPWLTWTVEKLKSLGKWLLSGKDYSPLH